MKITIHYIIKHYILFTCADNKLSCIFSNSVYIEKRASVMPYRKGHIPQWYD